MRLKWCQAKERNPKLSYRQIGEMFGVSDYTVRKFHKRWLASGKQFESLYNLSNRPHKTRARTELEPLIRRLYKKGHKGLRLQRELKKRGYDVSIGVMYRALHRMGLISKRPYKRRQRPNYCIWFPFGWVQADVKYANPKGPYQYTAIECRTRVRFMRIYPEISAQNSVDFISRCQQFFPFRITMWATDNGTEWTYAILPQVHRQHPVEKRLKELGIPQHLIPPATPQHNGRVERSHRTDGEDFYSWVNIAEAKETLESWLLTYNELREHMALGWKTPRRALEEYLKEPVTLNYALCR